MGANSEFFIQLQEQFINDCERNENGDISSLELAIKFKDEQNYLEQLANERKTWLNENLDSITDEAEMYQNEYKGYKITKQTRETLNFKNIPQWLQLEERKKEFEAKSKLALQLVKKGGLNVDENGEEIPLPEVNISSFIKMEKLKK